MRLAALILLLAGASRAEQSCPWLNAATAAGVVGGEVKSQVTDDSCTFTHDASQLRIEVHAVTPPYKLNCGPNATSLKAIGNEAIACSLDEKNAAIEQVTGRVRDQAFLVRLSTGHPSAARTAFREKTRLIAEQVAGILF